MREKPALLTVAGLDPQVVEEDVHAVLSLYGKVERVQLHQPESTDGCQMASVMMSQFKDGLRARMDLDGLACEMGKLRVYTKMVRGTVNLLRFLCHGESSVHGDSGNIVGCVCAQLGLDVVTLSELGLSYSRLPIVRQELKKSGWHLLSAGQIHTATVGMLVTNTMFAHKSLQWCHPTGRAMVVKFVWHNSPAVWIGSIYGFAKNRFDTVAQGEQKVLLEDIQCFFGKQLKKDDMVIMMGDFNSVGNFGDDQGDHMETWAAGLGLKHGYRL